ncbi:MAG: CBS domain-containing protein [Gammaproteobacteria bacterium]|jgi:CBS domain-containing protein
MEKKLLVRDYMTRKLTTLTPEMEIMQAVHTLLKRQVSGAPVLNGEGNLVGILTYKDCMKVVLNAAYHSEYCGTVADYMCTSLQVLKPDTDIVAAAQCFLDQSYHRYPVVEDNVLVGQISRSDILRALEDAWQWGAD